MAPPTPLPLHNAHVIAHLGRHRDWYDASLEADHWFSLKNIDPSNAAMLLCGLNPNETSFDDAKGRTTNETEPHHLVQLAQRFSDLSMCDPRGRTLIHWLVTARQWNMKYNSWIDKYVEAIPELADACGEGVPRALLHEAEESTAQRRERRYMLCKELCKASGLEMPNDEYTHLPRGIGKLAEAEGITRQAFAADVKAYIRVQKGK